jgi:prepilin-type N-terminal cleavage/methylation domain-containing protein
MNARPGRVVAPARYSERGVTMVELMCALAIIAIGVLAMVQLFPAGTRGQTRDHMRTQASGFAQQEVEDLSARGVFDAAMSVGRHPAAGADTLGTLRSFYRYYNVSQMPSPLDNLYKVAVCITWKSARPETVTATTYVRQ